jgi:hypothetical protein
LDNSSAAGGSPWRNGINVNRAVTTLDAVDSVKHGGLHDGCIASHNEWRGGWRRLERGFEHDLVPFGYFVSPHSCGDEACERGQ